MNFWLLAAAMVARLHRVASHSGKVTIFHSGKFAAHATPSWHPECAARTEAEVVSTVASRLAGRVELREQESLHPRVADGTALSRVHGAEYLASLAEPVGAQELRQLDPDTFASRASWNATRLATSAWLDAVDEALSSGTAFALARPPGHHASAHRACGFCTLNHAAVAAAYALDSGRAPRVALLDIDVHFGNGVAAIVGGDDSFRGRLRYASIHQHPAFPFSGGRNREKFFDKVGADALRFVPLSPGVDGPIWLSHLRQDTLPFLADLDPHLLLVSAGFDALASDHLAELELLPADYRAAGATIRDVFPRLPVAAGLEGGYDCDALPVAIAAFLDGLLQPPAR